MSLKKRYFFFFLLIVAGGMLFFVSGGQNALREVLFHIQQQQNALQRTISQTLLALRHGNNPAAWWSLVSLGLVYGILHAIGPGHGKAVVSTFLLTQPSGYKSALGLAVGGALLQGVSAILWVAVTFGLLQWFIRRAVGEIVWAERFSYLLVMMVGLYILLREGWRWHRKKQHAKHAEDCHCTPVTPPNSRRSHILAMIAVGIRPCSGSILALAVAASWHLWAVGITMTLAISLGTAVTVLTLALLTVYGREKLALNLSMQSLAWQNGFHVLILVGAVGLIVIGTILFSASFGAAPTGLPRV